MGSKGTAQCHEIEKKEIKGWQKCVVQDSSRLDVCCLSSENHSVRQFGCVHLVLSVFLRQQFAFRTRCPGPGSSNSHFVDKFIPAQQQLSQRCTNRASGVNWVQQHPDEDILMGSHGSVAMEALELGGWTSTSQVPHLISPHVWSTDIPSHITWNPPMARSTCRPRRQRQLVQLEMRQLISGVRDFGPQGPQGEVNSFAPGIPGPRLRASFWNVLMTSRTIPFHSRSCSVCVEVAFVQAAWISQRVHHQGVANTWGQP